MTLIDYTKHCYNVIAESGDIVRFYDPDICCCTIPVGYLEMYPGLMVGVRNVLNKPHFLNPDGEEVNWAIEMVNDGYHMCVCLRPVLSFTIISGI